MDVTYNFTAGTRAVAGQVNQNFADVKSAVDPLQTDVADIKTQLTSGIVLPDGSVDFTRLQSYKTYTVSNATNATPIVITAVGHGFLTGDKVYISGVGGNTAANGTFTITKLGTDTFSLDGSVGNGAFSSNGSVVIYPSADKNLVNKAYVDTGHFGICSTAAATAAKVVSIPSMTLTDGVHFYCKFTNANTSSTITLNVNSKGDWGIYDLKGNQITGTYFSNAANETCLLKADKTNTRFVLVTSPFWESRMGMPSNSYIDLTLGASGSTYTAPANGWIYWAKVAGGDWFYINARVLKKV